MHPPPVTHVYIGVCRSDLHLARTCLASVRYWYPDISISLLVDENLGKFDTSGLERDWNVGRFPTPVKKFGIGHSKLELMFRPETERYLALDADTLLCGPVIEQFDATAGDFVVHPEYQHPDDLRELVFDLDLLAKFDPAFGRNRLAFNCGHYVGTSGILRREDFNRVLKWTEPRQLRFPGIFRCGDQGIINYVLQKAEKDGRLSIGTLNYHLYVRRDTSAVTVPGIVARTSPPFIMHWAGIKFRTIAGADREDLLRFYRDFYDAHSGAETKRLERREAWRLSALRETAKRAFAHLGDWLAARPKVWGGEAATLAGWYLHHFYVPEKWEYVSWVWTEPEAGIDLQIGPHRTWVRMEAGSPFPLAIEGRNLRLFINGKEIKTERIEIADGVIEFELQPDELLPQRSQCLSWTIDRTQCPDDPRSLGLPLCGVWACRARGLPVLAQLGLRRWLRRGYRNRQQAQAALRPRA